MSSSLTMPGRTLARRPLSPIARAALEEFLGAGRAVSVMTDDELLTALDRSCDRIERQLSPLIVKLQEKENRRLAAELAKATAKIAEICDTLQHRCVDVGGKARTLYALYEEDPNAKGSDTWELCTLCVKPECTEGHDGRRP
jgi:hypothetical protein